MKQSLNTHDIYILTNELKFLQGSRVLNVYDINTKTICIKLNQMNTEKKYLVIESGTKFYLLDNFTAIRDNPTSFCSKLRKHLNNKRLEKIKQINLDRVIEITFGSDKFMHHLIGEFYASGNIILTSFDYKILTLIHPHTYKTTQTTIEPINNTSITELPNKHKVCVGSTYSYINSTTKIDFDIDLKTMFDENLCKINKIKLKQFISKLPLIKFSSNVIEHAFKLVQIDTKQKISSITKFEDIFKNSIQITNFIEEIKKMFELKGIYNGYIKSNNDIYPYAYAHINTEEMTTYDNFIKTTSNYFQQLNPIETKAKMHENTIKIKKSKQEKIIYNITQQIKSMEQQIKLIETQIELLRKHIDYIQNTMKYLLNDPNVNCSNFDANNFKIIEIIPYKKTIKFMLETTEFELNYTNTVYVSIEEFYKKIKKITSKLNNAVILLEKQNLQFKFNKIEQMIENEINNVHTIVQAQTKINWFEQFNWFYTSDKLLFISGKNAEQNELIVKRYMENNDIYLHSETYGSGSGLIKNPKNIDIPNLHPKSLIECGIFLIAHTKAWETNTLNNAYWVKPTQVSKTPESGEYISKGSFIIRGQKNFICVDKMELGLGILFKIVGKEEFSENIAFNGKNHINEQIEYAIPVLATYSALSNYKFKVKIINGTQKIKKALKEVINNFIKKTNLIEKEAIKKITNDSMQKVLINKIKFINVK